MVFIKKRKIGNNEYYYLEHSIKIEGKVQKKEKYLGKKIPENIEQLKQELIEEIFNEKWYFEFDKIKKGYKQDLSKTPLSAKKDELKKFSIRFTYDTQRIEGSTLTLKETRELLENGVSPNKKIEEIKQAEDHDNLFFKIIKSKKDINMQTVLYWHKLLFDNTKKDIAGKFRRHQVAISGSKFVPPFVAELDPLLKEMFSWYNKHKMDTHPVKIAALVHLKFVTIHPFSDGNGRISRLLMNYILNRYSFPMMNISYEKRAGYYNALEKSQVKNEEIFFLRWFFNRYKKENEKYLR